jgi:hypothetical protein
MDWVYHDGGRSEAGFSGSAGDCVPRAIAIATGLPYRQVYDELFDRQAIFFAGARSQRYATTRTGARRSASPRHGVFHKVYVPYMVSLGWQWTPTMGIGTGTTVHMRSEELPGGRLIARLSKHLAAVIDGVVYDTSNPARDGERCVYGFWTPPK